jgi:hypothetical protein
MRVRSAGDVIDARTKSRRSRPEHEVPRMSGRDEATETSQADRNVGSRIAPPSPDPDRPTLDLKNPSAPSRDAMLALYL